MQRGTFGFLKVIPIWVAFMSGLFSIVREVANLYAPTQTAVWGKSVFWTCAWVTFVVSSLTAWVLKHRELMEEKAKNGKPEIQGGIAEVYTDRVMELPPEKGKAPRYNCFITIRSHVFNARPTPTPPTVTFGLEVKTPAGIFPATRLPCDGLILKREHRVTGAVPQLSELQYYHEEMPELAPSGRVALIHGQEDWLRFIIPEEVAAMRDKEAITLIAIDDYGRPHRISSDRTEWKQTGELVRKIDLEHERILAQRLDKASEDN